MIEAAGRCLGFETKPEEATVEFVSRLVVSLQHNFTVDIQSVKRQHWKCRHSCVTLNRAYERSSREF